MGNESFKLSQFFYDDFTFGPPGFIPPPELGGEINIMSLLFEPGGPLIELSFYEPSAGTQWIQGEEVQIEWNYTGNIGPFNIDLIAANSFVAKIAEDVNASSYQWTIPDSISTVDNYRIRILPHYPAKFWQSELFSIISPQDAEEIIILRNELFQNIPNPFNSETTISFTLTTEITENTEIVIYNVKGQKVKTLINEKLPAGEHSVVWDGRDDNNKFISSSIYFYQLKTGQQVATRKMLLLK